LIDYGCGYGALADHLVLRNRHLCEYIGYDIAGPMLEAARSAARPLVGCRFVGRGDPLPAADYCLASGVFNVSLGTDPDVWFRYMTRVWDHMHDLGRVAFAFNCLSAQAGADRTGHLYHADPARVLAHCRRRYSPRVSLLHDYPLPEFTVVVRKAAP
jgi:SAM-dependent methyltransferase